MPMVALVLLLEGRWLADGLQKNDTYDHLDRLADLGTCGIYVAYEDCTSNSSWENNCKVGLEDWVIHQVSGISRWKRNNEEKSISPNCIYGLREVLLSTDAEIEQRKDEYLPLHTIYIQGEEGTVILEQLWNYYCKLSVSEAQDAIGASRYFDLILIHLSKLPNETILEVANEFVNELFLRGNFPEIITTLGFDCEWKKSFQDLLPSSSENQFPFIPRQSFQLVDGHIVDEKSFKRSRVLWSATYGDQLTRRDNCNKFSPDSCYSLGANRVILAEHIIYELASFLQKIPKYGS